MREVLDEQLSALLDGELPAEELDLVLSRLDRDPALRARYARYAMVGECLGSGSASSQALNVADRVRAALERQSGSDSIAVQPPQRASTGLLALAAVAALAVVALFVAGPGSWQQGPVPQLARNEARPVLQAPESADQLLMISHDLGHRADPQTVARLTGYLAAHVSYASPLSRSTMESHLVHAGPERATWIRVQGPADVP